MRDAVSYVSHAVLKRLKLAAGLPERVSFSGPGIEWMMVGGAMIVLSPDSDGCYSSYTTHRKIWPELPLEQYFQENFKK